MRLIDVNGNVKDLGIEEILCIKREVVQRKTMFCIGDEWFQEPNTLTQLVLAYQKYGFHQIDKNKLVNLNKVDSYKDGVLYAGSNDYLVSRRLQAKIKENLPFPLHER